MGKVVNFLSEEKKHSKPFLGWKKTWKENYGKLKPTSFKFLLRAT